MEKTYDRSVQDIGNILGMEHLNVQVPNQEMAQEMGSGLFPVSA